MKISEAKSIGKFLASLVQNGDIDAAQALLNPILVERTPFSALNQIGNSLADCPLEQVYILFDRLAADKYMGGWVVIGSALGALLNRDFEGIFQRCRKYIIAADVWYGADILGERVPGPALVLDFNQTLDILIPWQEDANRWVRRAVGVSVHYWAKKSGGFDHHAPSAIALLDFMTPMFTEWELDAAKGVGWGLKTLGRYYPELLTRWLVEQLSDLQLRYRAIVLRKSITYLPESNKAEILSQIP
jgi:3-methyladenine DNA glycosylase AlkD